MRVSLGYMRVVLVVVILIKSVFASGTPDMPFKPDSLVGVANMLGALMIVLLGVKWIIADAAQERNDIKKGCQNKIFIGLKCSI